MKTKAIALVLMIVTIISILPCTVNAAAADNTISPLWQNTRIINCFILTDSNGYAYAEGTAMGQTTVNKITADVYVYKQVGSYWVYVGEEHKTVNSCILTISYKFTPSQGSNYRADFTFVVTKNGVDETITRTEYKSL